MKKIPTLFERDWERNPSRVIDKVHPGCEWVLAGEGVATQKYDGTCCLLRGGQLFKRRELRDTDNPPPHFEVIEHDVATAKTVGWVPVGDGLDDRWFREADLAGLGDGTYELLGPKVQGNMEKHAMHVLQMHNLARTYPAIPRTYEGLRDWLAGQDIEGIVFHHMDGRMAKIKLRDFALKRFTRDA